MIWLRIAFWTVFLAAAATCLGESYHKRFQADSLFRAQVAQAKAEAAHIQSLVLFNQRTVPAGLPFAT
ncbi:MAG TPA: hypothetical protein VJS43_07365, partial [Candidatus Acidoferrales bacterium]|nr:hypothetical protein [Candidatus Acidoferrales bacterium]